MQYKSLSLLSLKAECVNILKLIQQQINADPSSSFKFEIGSETIYLEYSGTELIKLLLLKADNFEYTPGGRPGYLTTEDGPKIMTICLNEHNLEQLRLFNNHMQRILILQSATKANCDPSDPAPDSDPAPAPAPTPVPELNRSKQISPEPVTTEKSQPISFDKANENLLSCIKKTELEQYIRTQLSQLIETTNALADKLEEKSPQKMAELTELYLKTKNVLEGTITPQEYHDFAKAKVIGKPNRLWQAVGVLMIGLGTLLAAAGSLAIAAGAGAILTGILAPLGAISALGGAGAAAGGAALASTGLYFLYRNRHHGLSKMACDLSHELKAHQPKA